MFLLAIFLVWCTAISCAHGAEGKLGRVSEPVIHTHKRIMNKHGFIVVNSFQVVCFLGCLFLSTYSRALANK